MNPRLKNSATISGRLENRPILKMLCSSLRTAKLLKNWLTTMPA
jgi:hypothetical protein